MHEHHPGCEHDHAHEQQAAIMAQHMGNLCCSGQCSHIEHQSVDMQLAALQEHHRREEEAPTKKKKKKKLLTGMGVVYADNDAWSGDLSLAA